MPKKALKQRARKEQGNVCALTGDGLNKDDSMIDTHRPKHKKEGG